MSYNFQRFDDNATTWMAQYKDDLLPRNFTGLSVIWDENEPPPTRMVLPFKKKPFHFTQRIKIDPLLMAPAVQEGGQTPLTDRQYITQKYVCTPYKIGALLTEQMAQNGIEDAVSDVTQEVVESVNLSITYENINALQGIGTIDERALSRLNVRIAGKPDGTGTAVKWTEEDADILKDINRMKKLIRKTSARKAVALYVPLDEYEAIQNNEGIKEELKYVTPDFLSNGEIPMIKGIKIYEVATVYKDRRKRDDEKIEMLENKVIMVAEDVGYTAYNQGGTAPLVQRWPDYDRNSMFVQARASTVSVIKDYARVGIITGTS